MRCLVTGASGFVGSNLVIRLLKEGHFVFAIDNMSLRPLFDRKDFPKIINGIDWLFKSINDITPASFENIDWVFHTAAKVITHESINNPYSFFRTNVDGTANIFECARLAGVKKFIYLASGSCYGKADIIPTPETAAIKFLNPYTLTKYLGEEYVLSMGKLYNLPTISLRMFYIYGKSARQSSVFSKFAQQITNGEKLTVYGNGEQKCDYLYVDDAVDAILVAAKSNVTNDFFNIGAGKAYSVNELVSMIGKEAIHIKTNYDEPEYILADISKAKRILGWEPKISLDMGVKKTFYAI